MLTSFAAECELELRAAGGRSRKLRGRFPYGKPAVLSDGGRGGGRPKKEIIAPLAFNYRVARPEEDIHLLIGHSYDRPLASRSTGTLQLSDTKEALVFDALITDEIAETSWARDFFAAFNAGLIRGISPGFRLPPPRAVEKAEEVVEEDPSEGMALIRWIFAALLYELSFVTRPAYEETEVEERNWTPTAGGVLIREKPDAGLHRVLNRWRA